MIRRLLYALLVVCSLGCSKRESLSYHDLVQYRLDPSNGLLKTVRANNITIDAIFQPNDLLVAQEVSGEKNISPARLDSISKQYKRYTYFLLKFSQNGEELVRNYAGDSQSLGGIANYLNRNLGADLALLCGNDTLSVADFVHTNLYGVGESTNVMVAFDCNLVHYSCEQLFLVFESRFLGTGRVEFEYLKSELTDIPSLDFNKSSL